MGSKCQHLHSRCHQFSALFAISQDLQDFLDMYYKACSVLQKEQDFYDLMYAYLKRASIDNVYVAEVFFDPQTHTNRGISFDVIISGLHRALLDGHRDFGIHTSLIMCFLRHLSEEAAIQTLEQAKPHLDKILGVGLDSGEAGNPPSKFQHVYKMAGDLGLKLVAHAGEEAGPNYIFEALDILRVTRIDHGVQCLKDPQLVERLAKEATPLTTCPLSNHKLQVKSRFFEGRNVTRELLDKGLKVTVNSDDPAYFGGYITDNFLAVAAEEGLTEKDVQQICCNAFNATFLSHMAKQHFLQEIKHFNVIMGYTAPPRSISIFGSRSPQPGSPQFETASEMAKLFASRGFRVVNGGYYGIMEAASRGAREGGSKIPADAVFEGGNHGGEVHGIIAPRIFIHRPPTGNEFLTHSIIVRNLTTRVYHLLRGSEYYFVFGGTIGTMAELMVVWNAASLRQMYGGVPQKIFVWRPFWEMVLKDFIDTVGVYSSDVALLTFVDSAEEALEIVEKDLKERIKASVL